eukprot:GFUD01011294.1.p1 GENE.GFUD01011294.1~~GFUD01011294.1.p1  ORF type:complete len:730 (-),score=165.48 GFUD01011294.1:151-2340(-)
MKYFLCFSILSLSSLTWAQINFPTSSTSTTRQNFKTNLDFRETLESRAGRHLLLVTLLENLNQPVSLPRFKGQIAYQLPSTLKDESTSQPLIPNRGPVAPATKTCCQLEDVPETPTLGNRQPGGKLQLQDLLGECSSAGVLSIQRGMHFRLFNNTEKQLATNLAEILLSKDSFSHLLSVTAAVRDYVNQELFREALVNIILRRDDVGMVMPMSPEFLPANVVSNTKEIIQSQTPQQENPVVDVNWNEPPYQTYDQSEPEFNLWYFREDPEANSHHLYWHSLFNNASLDRRGEFFFYMHRQMLIRYKVERLTQGLTEIKPLTPDTWDKPLPLGYFPKLGAESGTPYQGRPDNLALANLTDISLPLSLLKDWYSEIESAIKNRRVITAEGSTINLRANQGRDEGISVLGDIVEALNSVNGQLYGSLHNLGHVFIARVTDPRGRHLTNTGVMNSPATSMRDPIFYRWHQFIDDIFTDYKASLPAYTEEELSFPGVKIVQSQVTTDGKRNELHTLTDQGEVLLPGIDFGSNTTVRFRYNRLNHQPFQYNILVNSKSYAVVKAKVRIFLIPKETPNHKAPLAVEMDRFLVNLKKGNNIIKRTSSQSTVTGKRQRSLLELQEALFSGNITESELSQFEGCGWPAHLLVPRGTASGPAFSLVVMLSKLLPGDAALSADQEKVAKSAFVHCGLPGSDVPDSRPMGFPFDRPVGWRLQGRSNMAVTDVRILHQESLSD